jgi:polyhydroxyalkanoate synthesis regulator phasin
MCRECKHTIFSSRDFHASLLHKPPDQRAYETLCQFERGIRQLLPSFHRVLLALQPEKSETGEVDLSRPPPSHAQIQEAAKIRKRLVDSFAKYGAAAKRLRDLPSSSKTQQRLQMAVYTYASSFLHTNMLPLKSLPHLLRTRSAPQSSSSRFLPHPLNHSSTSSSLLRHSELAESSPSTTPVADDARSTASSAVVSQLETEEKDLRERLVVLEEQRFVVGNMLRAATTARRFEEVTALSGNVDELDAEIAALQSKVRAVEERWEGVYRDGGAVASPR